MRYIFGEKGSKTMANAAKIMKVITRQRNPFLDIYYLLYPQPM